MDQDTTYDALKKELLESVGYAGRLEIPTELVRKIAVFLDAYPDDSMTTYYANSLLDQFYRKRTKERSIRLFDLLSSYLNNKSPLIDLFLQWGAGKQYRIRAEQYFDAATIWSAIRDLGNGYDKANCIDKYAYLFTDEVASLAYHDILQMCEPFNVRAIAGIYPKMDALHKEVILTYVLQQFSSESSEAAYRLKFMFPYMDRASRAKVVAAHLDSPDVREGLIAYLVIRNAAYFDYDDAVRLAARVRTFESDYYRNRCLLKLATYLHDGEIEKLYEQFMVDFNTQPATSARIHNLYHFGSVLKALDSTRVISLALEKIGCLDDSVGDFYEQAKYGEMMFVIPLLTEAHREQAFAIAGTIKGRYRQTVMSKLNAHLANSKDFCRFLGSPIFY